MRRLKHTFLPHHPKHKKAHIIRPPAIFFYIVFLTLFHLSINTLVRFYPGVLGITSAITAEELVRLTNDERTKNGLPPLNFNQTLALAAARKGQDMLANNYWAHTSPSGRDPWSFIREAGYQYLFAGENLAKDFVDPASVVAAWMASPSHRENILNKSYQDLGIAVLEGNLGGYKTALVVQMFATPQPRAVARETAAQKETPRLIAKVPPGVSVESPPTPVPTIRPLPTPKLSPAPVFKPPAFLVASTQKTHPRAALVSPFTLTKIVSVGLIFLLLGIFSIDILAIATGQVVRVGSHSLAHAAMLGVLLLAILYTNVGVIA